MSCYYLEPAKRALEVLQAHLPMGIAWECFRRTGKVAYRLFQAFASSYEDAWTALCRVPVEIDPRTTTELIDEWEASLSLPDACLPLATTLEERRDWVLWRLDKRRWTTVQDWLDLADLFDLEVEITPGFHVQRPALFWLDDSGHYPPFPLRLDIFPKLGRFRVYIDVLGIYYPGFEYGKGANPGFPIPFEDGPEVFQKYRCLIERVKPANVVVIWNNNPLRNSCYAETFEDVFGAEFC